MSNIVKVKVARRGARGALEPADRTNLNAAVTANENLTALRGEMQGARDQAVEAAGYTADDLLQTEEYREQTAADRQATEIATGVAQTARDEAELAAGTIAQSYSRRDFFLTREFSAGLGAWVSANPQAPMTLVGTSMYVTSNVAAQSSYIALMEGSGFKHSTRGVSRVRIKAIMSYAPRAGSLAPGRVRALLGHADSATAGSGTAIYSTLFTLTQEPTEYTWEIAVNGNFRWFDARLQLQNGVGNDFIIEHVEAIHVALEASVEVGRKEVRVADRAEILRASIGDGELVFDRSTGLTYKRRLAEPTANAPLTMADGTFLLPAFDADIRLWGAVADGAHDVSSDNLTVTNSGTQSWPAMINWLRWCMANKRDAILPEGDFLVTNYNETAFRTLDGAGTGSIRIKGKGRDKSRFLWNDHRGLNGIGRIDFLQMLNMVDITFEDFGVIGDWRQIWLDQVTGDVRWGGHIFSGQFAGKAELRNVRLSGAHFFSWACGGGRQFRAHNCRVDHSARDGLHSNVKEYFEVTHCEFYRVFDDAIASHLYELPDAGKPYSPEYLVAHNRLEQCQGIALLGARKALIHDNHGRNIYTRWISTNAGTQAPCEINIHNNTCENILDQSVITGLPTGTGGGQGKVGIFVGTSTVEQTEGTATMGPDADGNWTFESNGAGVAKPYGRLREHYPARNTPPAFSIKVHDNKLNRLLEIGQLWSEQAVPADELLWCRIGPVDPVITRNMICEYAITVSDIVADVTIAGNEVFGFERCVSVGTESWRIANSPQPNRHLHRVAITQNSFANYTLSGIQLFGAGTPDVWGNTFDGDPLFEHPDHAADGTWGDTNAAAMPCVAVAVPGTANPSFVPNLIFRGNKLANLRSPFSRVITSAALAENILRGDFVSQSDAGNRGIRDLQYHPNRMGTLIYEGSDATDKATFLIVKHANNRVQDAMPTIGHWIAGTIVDLALPLVSGSDLIVGYCRLTTGSGHVLGTDWRAILA